MNHLNTFLSILLLAVLNQAQAQTPAPAQARLVLTRDVPYATPANPRQKVRIPRS